EEWASFRKAIGTPDWCGQDKFNTCQSRIDNLSDLNREVSSWTSKHNKFKVMEMLQQAGVPATPMLDGQELIQNEHLKDREFLTELDHPEVGYQVTPGVSMTLSESPGSVSRAPLLGEHNHYVFGDLLGLDEDEIVKLREEKIIF
ncbi:CoA transferase, partial [bacterium]|nr:CoA transferase [bacterium]